MVQAQARGSQEQSKWRRKGWKSEQDNTKERNLGGHWWLQAGSTSHFIINKRNCIPHPIQFWRELKRIGWKSDDNSEQINNGEAFLRPKYFLSKIKKLKVFFLTILSTALTIFWPWSVALVLDALLWFWCALSVTLQWTTKGDTYTNTLLLIWNMTSTTPTTDA